MSENVQKTNPLLADQLCFAVYEANRLFNAVYAKALAPFELTYTQYIVLLVLFDQDGQRLTEIAQTLSLKSNTLSPLLKRLESSGWIKKQVGETDKRSSRIFLTEKATRAQVEIFHSIQSCVPVTTQAELRLYQEALATVNAINHGLNELL
ncbi:MAG: MarR family winged helix-turn-helix transcriptional regulator [Enterococcus sp.]